MRYIGGMLAAVLVLGACFRREGLAVLAAANSRTEGIHTEAAAGEETGGSTQTESAAGEGTGGNTQTESAAGEGTGGNTQTESAAGEGTGGNIHTGTPQTEGTGESVSGEDETEERKPESPGEKSLRRTSGAMDAETAQWLEAAGEELALLASERDIMALVYLGDEYPVRSLPSPDSGNVVMVPSGQLVNIRDVYADDDMEIWYYIQLDYRGQELYGYVPRTHLACSDARFLEWEERYGLNLQSGTYAAEEGQTAARDIEEFPESYRPALLALKEKHPNWTFVKMYTGLDWESVIYHELQGGRSLVHKSFPAWTKEGVYDEGNWYYASEAILKLYMDPRNSLHEDAIFQFEQLTYNEQYHTQGAVEDFLKNTFMNSNQSAPGTSKTYAQIFWDTARAEKRKISPFHLAARVLQEQGAGTSPLISGNYKGYEGYYNYFNIGATGTTNQQVYESGLSYAKKSGWTNAELAIQGGADFISGNYIRKGQDTLYLQKFNVNPDSEYGVYNHQYMQNISAPNTEGKSIKRLYESAGALNSAFVFKIPVFENMPGEACPMPEASTNVVLKLPGGYSDTTAWLDGVPLEGKTRNGSLIVNAADGSAKTAVLYKYNEAGSPTGMYVWLLSYNGGAYTATAVPELEDLLTYHGFSIRITGKSGIRFKTGISADLRAKLVSTGVSGYVLKEYGTLVMNTANMDKYPMIKGGEKVAGGVSYGRNSDGTLRDVIFETKEGRYRYTSVLTGLPAEQYKTGYAFRGYAVLEKGGSQIVLYGPARSSSIYELANLLLENQSYQPGTAPYEFLQKLISDADALDASKAAGE